MARLLSVNTGMPKDVPWQGKNVHTGIWKHPVDGPVMVRRLNLDGDGQGDLNGHGGEMRAVLVYQRESYDHWRRHLGRDDLEYGRFGENFTVDGLADDEVHIGDRYRIGDAEFEVTQPRVTCFRVGMRLEEPRMPALMVAHHRPGFYLRVITEGHVQAGDEIVRTRIGRHRMSVAAIDALLYLPDPDIGELGKAVDIPALSPGWQSSFHDLLDAAAATPAEPSDGWVGFRRLRVSRIVPESATVVSVHLAAVDGLPLPAPEPGQYLTLRFPGAGDPPPVRNYSLSGTPDCAGYRISVKRDTHGLVSTYIHTRLRPGSLVDAAAPRGDFVLPDDQETGALIFLSAGIGVTPLLAMLHHLAATTSRREIWWLHTTRTAADHAFAAEAHQLLNTLDRSHEHIYYTAEPAPGTATPVTGAGRIDRERLGGLDRPTTVLGTEPAPGTATPVTGAGRIDRERLGGLDRPITVSGTEAAPGTATPVAGADRIDREKLAALGLPTTASVYLCGPAGFMADMREALVGLGLNPGRIHTELFGSLSAINPGLTGTIRKAPHPPSDPAGTGPSVTFTRSGVTAPWNDAYGSILELAEACDIPTRWSCRSGVCHTCQTPVLTGRVRYRPCPLQPPALGTALVCCSQPESDLILDL
ncbi:sulfurase [Acrocarpospora phusangensis]|uniref:Sulfurase n=1 Tax=Acrocarpospora phusangensis TaxID=1070424 RepID=A0A919QD86_9ACTN|nr:MOSC and FAD-binding oxidoreductase domain-containing protein [Acrocarpospora phusangensis]GIH25245.1 sulfurase [Acrocarpospora phusangensis]